MSFSEFSDEQLLDRVADHRIGETRDEEALVLEVQELQARGVYPEDTVPGNRNSVLSMVNGWGAHWYIWKGTLECPNCKADLRNHKTGPPFKREIGHSNGDWTTKYSCPDCGHSWPRRLNVP